MNRAKVFETVKQHLLSQNVQARYGANGGCRYRTESGLRCAIGCLIPDGHLGLKYKGTVTTLLATHPDLKKLLGVKDGNDICFLLNLQRIHDHNPPSTWSERLDLFEEENFEQD